MTPEKLQSFSPTYCSTLNQNKTFKKIVKNLIHRLLHQFRSEAYDVNSILIEERKEMENNKSKIAEKLKLLQDKNNQEEGKETSIQKLQKQREGILLAEEVWAEVSIFIWQLGYSPKCYVEMFENEEIHAEESEIIDMHVFTSKIYKKVLKKCRQFTSLTNLFEDIAADQVYFFLEEVSKQICIVYSECRKIIFRQLEETTEIVQKSKIINFYVLFKVFKDLSSKCIDMISQNLEERIFKNVEYDIVIRFARYILQKYEILKLEMNKEDEQNLQELALQKKASVVDQLMNSNSVRWREAVGEDGEMGIMIEIDNENGEEGSPKKNYMVMLDDQGQVKIMHCNSLYKKWKVCKKAEKNYEIVNLIKNEKALAAKLRGTQTRDHAYKMTMIDGAGMFGGTMGRTLAEIDQFNNAGEFVAALSKRMIIGGSVNYMISTVPLLGYVFITGGYTYSFYYIFSNKYSNKNKKFRQIRNMTLGVASSVGSAIVGATIGQTLIPVPILGAFIGGFVGGFIGQIGGRAINQILETQKFKETIELLNKTMQPKGYWQVNAETLKILEIKKEKFYETIPTGLETKMNCDRIWMTLIFFTLFTFSESERRVKFLNKKLKEMKKKENFQIIQEDLETDGRDEYQPSLNILCIMTFLEENHIYYLDFHDNIAHIMQKMFARLK